MFKWIRQQVKAAVLAGCEDALAEMGEPQAEALRERLAPALPAHEPEAEANGRQRQKAKAA